MNDEGGGMVLGNCARCAGSLWQFKRTGAPALCDSCKEDERLRAQPNTEKKPGKK